MTKCLSRQDNDTDSQSNSVPDPDSIGFVEQDQVINPGSGYEFNKKSASGSVVNKYRYGS
jgi:hypothetical protein